MSKKPPTSPLVRGKIPVHEIVNRLETWKPKSVADLVCECRLPLQLLDWGAYRNCWDIVGNGLVIKLVDNLDPNLPKALTHVRIEVAAHKKIMNDDYFKHIRKYMPRIHYANTRTGLVLMDKYRPCSKSWAKRNWRELDKVYDKFAAYFPEPDISSAKRANYGFDRQGRLKLIDLGCLSTVDHLF